MHIHYLQHERNEDLAFIGQWASQNDVTTSATLFFEEPVFLDFDAFDWLIIMGGPMAAYEEEKYTWLISEKVFIKKAISAGKIVLGICLGSQLIADALDAKVSKNEEAEIGFFPVIFSREAQSDKYFRHFPRELMTMHWHGDTFELPEGAIHMASSSATLNQAFRWGNRVFALQFHPEFTEDSVRTLLKTAAGDLWKNGKWIQHEDQISNRLQFCKENNKYLSDFLDEIVNSCK
jgi:GMP synthase-like glutamine amidotransferase